MAEINVAEAKARLSELLERAASGEVVTVSRRGKPVARIVGAEEQPKRIDREELRRLTASMPPATGSAAEFVRRMRDEDRF